MIITVTGAGMGTGRPAAFSGLEAEDANRLQHGGPVPLLGKSSCPVLRRQAPSTLHMWGSHSLRPGSQGGNAVSSREARL